ncbi:MAG: 50S ribosomal protein L1 [Mycoplasmataceae bacterium RC_NB112A]|nr:MAG: 50S ribosomal protein L1 [Mycoplasmataceae bacterium RC_NB112A]
MTRSPRYQKVKSEISPAKFYSLPESLNFLQKNNSEKLKNIKVSFTLNQAKQKVVTTLKSKIILPHPLLPKGKIAVVKEDLPAETINNLTKKKEVELLSVKEFHQRIIEEKTGKIKKKNQWGFEKLVLHPQNEKKFKLPEKLPPKLFGLIARKVLLTEKVLEAVNNFQQGEQEIRTDKGGNIHALIGKSDYPTEKLEKNYQFVYNEVNKLRPAKWKGSFIKKIILSTTMGPGLKIYQ